MSSQLHALASLPRGKSPSIHWIGGWVDRKAGLEDIEKTHPELELQPLDCRVRSQSLYRLRYRSSVNPIQ
jgi:hypothetical protein